MPTDKRRSEHSDLTPEQRSERASRAANARWDRNPYDRTAATQPARDGFERWLEDQVDPERRLEPQELQRRLDKRRSRYYSDLAKRRGKRLE